MRKWLWLLLLAVAAPVWAQTHSVDLSWTQSPSSGVTANKVYRGTTAGGPYILVFTSTAPVVSFSNTGLPQLTTYYYVVTAVCTACVPSESVFSNEVKVTTLADPPPPQPNAPSGLTATPH